MDVLVLEKVLASVSTLGCRTFSEGPKLRLLQVETPTKHSPYTTKGQDRLQLVVCFPLLALLQLQPLYQLQLQLCLHRATRM